MVLKTIRENETRARMVGYNVRRYKLASFIIAAIYAAVAGTLYGLFLNYMFPQTLDWIRSGDVVIMALIGGMGTFFGPIIGAGVVVALRVLISIYAKIGGLVFWQFFMGIIFLMRRLRKVKNPRIRILNLNFIVNFISLGVYGILVMERLCLKERFLLEMGMGQDVNSRLEIIL